MRKMSWWMCLVLALGIVRAGVVGGESHLSTATPEANSKDVAFLRDLATRVLDSAQIRPGDHIPGGPTNVTRYTLRVPGGTQSYYPAFWVRDASMMLGGPFVPAAEIEGWVRLVAATQPGATGLRFGRLIVPPFSIPDHITLAGEACWYPGAYTEQGTGKFGILPPADDAFYFIQMVHAHWGLTRSLDLFRARVQTGWGENPVRDVCLRAFDSVAVDPGTGLVRGERAEGEWRVDWGFCDTIGKAGLVLMPSLLRWTAARDLAEMCEADQQASDAKRLRAEMQKIATAIPSVFGREATGHGRGPEMRLLSATELGIKDDVWASAYAVWLGLLPPNVELAVARHLLALYREGGTVLEGQVRHLPPAGEFGGFWEKASCERDRYQNGGYWATPTGWFIAALRKVDRAAADRVLAEYVSGLREHEAEGAPWEWVFPPAKVRVNPLYGSSVGCVYIALEAEPATSPALHLSSPLDFEVFQRHTAAQGTIAVAGDLSHDVPNGCRLEWRLRRESAGDDWHELIRIRGGQRQFRGEFAAPAGGWFRLEIRATQDGATLVTAAVEHVGVGEVFVVAGQSNSANHGAERQHVETGLVSAFSGSAWTRADDPQPGASGDGGSFIPPFGDAMAREFKVPVGIVAAGVGATSVREWLPKGAEFANPPTLTNRVRRLDSGVWESDGKLFESLASKLRGLGPHGFRALLWHQGESDANQQDPTRTLPGSIYEELLTRLIRDSRQGAGWDFPWFVAQASYHTPDDPGSAEIRNAQRSLSIAGIALEGPDTDALRGNLRDNNGRGVHFSGPGLRAHAAAWVEKVAPWLKAQL